MGIFTSSSALRSFVEDAEVELPLPDEAVDNHEEIEDAHTGEIDPDPVVDPVEESYKIYAESERNFHNLMMAVGISELGSYHESGIDYIHEAPDIRAFWEKVKKFFKTLKEKIWAVIKNFIARIQVRFQNGAKFVAKYGSQIKNGFNKIKNEDFKIKGFKFTNTDWSVDFKKPKAKLKDKLSNTFAEFNVDEFVSKVKADPKFYEPDSDEDVESMLDMFRADQVKSSGEVSASEYADELFRFYHGGETSKESLDKSDVDIGQVLTVLKSGSKYIGKVKKNYREIEKECNAAIKKANEFESKLSKAKDTENVGRAMSYVNQIIKMEKDMINITHQANAAHLSALKGELAQARRVALRCVQGDNKVDKKLFGESYYDSSASVIDSVKFK